MNHQAAIAALFLFAICGGAVSAQISNVPTTSQPVKVDNRSLDGNLFVGGMDRSNWVAPAQTAGGEQILSSSAKPEHSSVASVSDGDNPRTRSMPDDGVESGAGHTKVPGPRTIKTTDVYISQIPCPQGADLNTGFVYGTTTPAMDAGPCITKYLNSHVKPGNLLILHQDGASVSSGIVGPTGGWGIVSGLPPGISVAAITGCKITSNVISCETKPNDLVAGQGAILNGFTAGSHLNLTPLVISSTGLSRTNFRAPLKHPDASVGAGEVQILHGNGFFQKAGANADVINNGITNPACPGGYEDPGWSTPGPAPARGSGLVFQNLMLNGNRLYNSTSGSLTGIGGFTATYNAVPYCFYIGLNVYDVNDVKVEGNYFFQTSAYNLRLMNVGFTVVNDNKFDEFGPGAAVYESNSDGLHISGPANNITADGNFFRTGDDAWALNAAEGWVGPITYVAITNSQYEQALSGGRMYTYSVAPPTGDAAPRIDHVLVNGGIGTVQVVPHIIGNEGAHSLTVAATMSDIVFANEYITMDPGAYSGSLASGNGIVVADNIADLTFDNVQIDNIRTTASAPSFINLTDSANVVTLNLTNVTATRSAAGHSVQGIVDLKTGYYSPAGSNTIQQLTINGARVMDSDGGAYGKAPYVLNTGTSKVHIFSADGIDFANLDALVSDASRVNTFAGRSLNPGGRPSCTSNVKLGTGSGNAGICDAVSGFDTSSNIVITTGRSPAAASALFTISFVIPREHNVFCEIQPTNNAASALANSQRPFLTGSSTASYTVYSGATALPGNTQLSWAIICP